MKLKSNRNITRLALTALSIGALLGSDAFAADAKPTGNGTDGSMPPVFAKVGKTIITQREFDGEFAEASRNRFYHGKPPEAEVAALQREIGDKLINRVLLLNEARRLKLKPDSDFVNQKLEMYEQKNANNPQWQNIRDRALPVLTKRFQEESLRNKLEQRVRNVPAPNEKKLRAYYTAHLDKFTEPEQLRVSVILLKIDPSAPDYDTARKKGEDLLKQLRAGADFAELATLYSGDADTVEQGGDMGYLHAGMLPELAQEVVNKLKPGEISEVTGLMEGMAIFKLTARNESKLSSFETVKQRAGELYRADEGERAWKSLIAKLRKNTAIKVDESRFLPLPNTVSKSTEGQKTK